MKYSDKDNINILTSLLIAHGVHKAVVCPGSRNAPITHNLCASAVECVSVTDERSAAFIALGMAQAREEPVAVCVTSGSALLNTLPAVAEARYQGIPLIIISADRPAAMIDQLQGQTLPQPAALGCFVKTAVSLPEPHDDVGRWHCNRLVNEALIVMRRHGNGPVHINVPVTEPLFNFTHGSLPDERVVRLTQYTSDKHAVEDLAWDFCHAKRPMLVIGQLPFSVVNADEGVCLKRLRDTFVVLQEQLSADECRSCPFDEALTIVGDNPDYQPDFVVYIGGTLVSKRIKRFLQGCTTERTVIVNESGALTDVTMHATEIMESRAEDVIEALASIDGEVKDSVDKTFYNRWMAIIAGCDKHKSAFQPGYSQMLAVNFFHDIANNQKCSLQYGNSSAVRLGQIYSTHYLYINRGVNGIEGSLSTAVGFASVSGNPVYCVIGDLSFFYDQNALWNNVRKGNLRILLLNNGGGGIFHQLPGLAASPFRDGYIAAGHSASARGICMEACIAYRCVTEPSVLQSGIGWLTGNGNGVPRLLEVMTNAEQDADELKRYYQFCKL